MPDPLYECLDCHQMLIACPRCGQLLHDPEETHLRTPFQWCTGRLAQFYTNWARASFEA